MIKLNTKKNPEKFIISKEKMVRRIGSRTQSYKRNFSKKRIKYKFHGGTSLWFWMKTILQPLDLLSLKKIAKYQINTKIIKKCLIFLSISITNDQKGNKEP